jgi:hypothetical protein
MSETKSPQTVTPGNKDAKNDGKGTVRSFPLPLFDFITAWPADSLSNDMIICKK